VEDQELLWSRRILGLPPVDLEPPLPPLRRKLDQQGYIEATGLQETIPDSYPRGENFNLEEPIISNLRVEDIGSYNPPITDLLVPIVVQV
jgi:hypothetical protein